MVGVNGPGAEAAAILGAPPMPVTLGALGLRTRRRKAQGARLRRGGETRACASGPIRNASARGLHARPPPRYAAHMTSPFRTHMDAALAEARAAAARGETPVGAVIVDPATGVTLAAAGNRTRELLDPTAHAEILAIRAACAAVGSERLPGMELWVTLEPCPICAAAIAAARIGRLIYGAPDPKSGGVEQGPRIFDHPQSHHRPEVIGGVAQAQCAALLRAFFAARR
jgi:cytidine deaminase